MDRSSGLLIFAALCCVLSHGGALKATSLIFGRTTTSTTSTTEATADETKEYTTEIANNNTSTGPTLTGIPQIDYIWDPNLPRELNGYNLSDYPFYSVVPTAGEIDFRCEGLHDGFYASVQHKCQLYHHCIDNVRYDFLCANFTAFDQRTFICHFVSEVDCKNSPKYFHRNDNLYQATTSATTTTSSTTTPVSAGADVEYKDSVPSRHSLRPLRRPYRRRRPQVDYYYYDEDYADEDYYERRANRRRKQRPVQREFDYDSDDDVPRNIQGRQEIQTNYKEHSPEDSTSYERRPVDRPRNRNRAPNTRPRFEEDRNDHHQITENKRRHFDEARRNSEDRKKHTDDRRNFKETVVLKQSDEEEDYTENDRRFTSRRRTNGRRSSAEGLSDDLSKEDVEIKPLVRSSAPEASLFARPRAPPKVSRPVPLDQKKKFEYNPQTYKTTPVDIMEDLYDEYQEYVTDDNENLAHKHKPIDSSDNRMSKRPRNNENANQQSNPGRVRDTALERNDKKLYMNNQQRKAATRNISPEFDSSSFEQDDGVATQNVSGDQVVRTRGSYISSKSSPSRGETIIDYDTKKSESGERTRLQQDSEQNRARSRVVKRPFLPSRGGSPYLPRGLDRVGVAHEQSTTESFPFEMGSTVSAARLLQHSAPIVRRPVSSKIISQMQHGPRIAQLPLTGAPSHSLDDLFQNEYDVTLNDALDPTLKPLVVNDEDATRYKLNAASSATAQNITQRSPAAVGQREGSETEADLDDYEY